MLAGFYQFNGRVGVRFCSYTLFCRNCNRKSGLSVLVLFECPFSAENEPLEHYLARQIKPDINIKFTVDCGYIVPIGADIIRMSYQPYTKCIRTGASPYRKDSCSHCCGCLMKRPMYARDCTSTILSDCCPAGLRPASGPVPLPVRMPLICQRGIYGLQIVEASQDLCACAAGAGRLVPDPVVHSHSEQMALSDKVQKYTDMRVIFQ